MINCQVVMDNQLKKNQLENKRPEEISLSQIGKCNRQLIMSERKYSKIEFTERQLRVFAAGYLYEKFALDLYEQAGYILKRQIPTAYKGIKGTADAILTYATETILIDVKSVHSRKFLYLGNEVDEGYCYQLISYYLGLEKEYKFTSFPKIVYISKD